MCFSGCVFHQLRRINCKFHCSSKSFDMASHSSRDEGGCKHAFQRTVYIASHVSDIIFDTQIFPYHMEMTKMFAIHQQQEIIERYRVFHLLILATKNLFLPLKLMVLKLQPMTKTLLRHSYVALKEEKSNVHYFTYYAWHYGSRYSEVFTKNQTKLLAIT